MRAFEKILLGHEYDVELPFDEPRFIVDAGANVGYTSIFFANKYPHSEIVAIEPEQSNVEVLCDNVRGYDNIDVLHGAVWPHDGTVAIRNRESDKWSFEVVEASFTGNRTVRAVSVGSLLQQYARDSIDILKVDIEGAEKEVFEGDVSLWLPRTKTIIIELHDRKRSGCSVAFYRAVCKYEFEQYQKGMNVIWINKTRGN